MSLGFIPLAYVACLGASVGSFLNVVICRLPLGQSVVSPRSACPTCRATLLNRDNVPLLSFLFLGGRCRFCKTRISPRYFCVELVTLGLFVATYVRFGMTGQTCMWLVLDALFVALIFLDIDYWWLPDVLTFPAMAVACIGALIPGGLGFRSCLFGLFPALSLWGVSAGYGAVVKKETMGFGDIKLMAVIGLALGARDGSTALMLASFEGAVLGSLILLRGGHRGIEQNSGPPVATATALEKGLPAAEASAALAGVVDAEGHETDETDDWIPPKGAVPFGPFLALGTFQVMLLPETFGSLPTRLVEAMVGYLSP